MLDLIKKKKDEIINKKELSKSDLENLIIYGYLLLSIIENKLIVNYPPLKRQACKSLG